MQFANFNIVLKSVSIAGLGAMLLVGCSQQEAPKQLSPIEEATKRPVAGSAKLDPYLVVHHQLNDNTELAVIVAPVEANQPVSEIFKVAERYIRDAVCPPFRDQAESSGRQYQPRVFSNAPFVPKHDARDKSITFFAVCSTGNPN